MESRTNDNPIAFEHTDDSGKETRLNLDKTDGVVSGGEFKIGDEVSYKFTFPPPPKENPWELWKRCIYGLGAIVLIAILAYWAYRVTPCFACEELQEVDYSSTPTLLQDNNPPNVSNERSSSQSSNSSSSYKNENDSKKLARATPEMMLKIWDKYVIPITTKYHVALSHSPEGYTPEEILAGIAARESGGNPWAVNNDTTMGLMQVTPIRAEYMNKERQTPLGSRAYLGDSEGALSRSFFQFKTVVEDMVSLKSSVHACINSQSGNCNNPNPTDYSECVLDNIQILRKALKERGDKLAAVSSEFFNPLPTQQTYIRGISTSGDVHHGHDLGAQPGYPIHAVHGGLVIEKAIQINSKTGKGYGKYVVIDDGEFVWLYAHMKQFLVDKNEYITGDHIVGTVGDTGAKGNFHLHIECWTKAEWDKRKAGKPATPIKRIMWPTNHKKNGSLALRLPFSLLYI